MKPLPVAVLGCGHLGRIHTRLLKANPAVEIVGVVDPIENNRGAFAREFAVPAFADFREIPASFTAAIVATPTQFHHVVALDLLRRGIHTFVEKPITVTLGEADELVAVARQNQLVLQVGHVERFNPSFVAARQHVTRPRYIEGVRASGYTGRSTDIGVVLDLMIHDLDLVLSLVDSPVVDVEAVGGVVLGPHEDLAHARLKFANGCVANLNASRTSFQMQRSMHIYGDLSFAAIDFATNTVKVVHPRERLLTESIDVNQMPAAEKSQLKDRLYQDFLQLDELTVEKGNAIQAEHTDFVDSIQSGRDPQVTGEHGRQALAVAQEILAKIAAADDSHRARIFTVPHGQPTPGRRKAG